MKNFKKFLITEAYEVGTNEYREYLEKLTPGEMDEASARADAMRGMRRGREVDPADVDTDATDDDIKGASKNIIMQMRKAVSLRGKFPVEFGDGKKVKIPAKIGRAVQDKYNSLKKPADKEKFQAQVAKSYKDMLKVLKAGFDFDVDEEAELDEAVSDAEAMKAKYTLIKVAKKGERKSQSFWTNLLKVANSGPQGTIITADDLKRVDDHSNKIKRDVRLAKKNKREEAELDEGKLPDMRDALMQVRAEKPIQLDEQLAKIRGNTPADKGRRAAVEDDIERAKKKGDKKEVAKLKEDELDEAKYELYHKDFSTAMQHAYKMAKKLHGITIDPKEIDDKVASGPRKPSEGKTNTYRLKGDKGAIQVQVYNKGGSKPYELNFYKEEVELDEAKSQGMFIVLEKGSKNKVIGQFKDKKKAIDMMKKNAGSKVIQIGKYATVDDKPVDIKIGDKLSDTRVKLATKVKEEVELDEKKGSAGASLKDVMALDKKHAAHKKQSKKDQKRRDARQASNRAAGMEEVDLDEAKPEFEVKYAKSKRGPFKVTKFMTLDQAKEFLADVKKDGMNGIISKGGKPVKEETILERIDRKLKERKNG